MTYLVTFSCYGCHFHGDERGSVDRRHNQVGSRALPEQPALRRFERGEMREAPYVLDTRRREIVLEAVLDVCGGRGWSLFAAHIRRDHVHLVVSTESRPKQVVGDLKAYASRALTVSGLDGARSRRWTRGGSVRRLSSAAARARAVDYVLGGQGTPMAVYVARGERAT